MYHESRSEIALRDKVQEGVVKKQEGKRVEAAYDQSTFYTGEASFCSGAL